MRNSSLEVCVFHSQFCVFEAHCKTKMPSMQCWRGKTMACNEVQGRESTDFHFANYRSTDLHFAKYRFSISQSTDSTDFSSQSTDFHFVKNRFSFRKVQIFTLQSTDFHFARYRFHFLSQITISQSRRSRFRLKTHTTRSKSVYSTYLLFHLQCTL